MVDPVQLVLGVVVLWAPGLAWTWALVPGLDWAKFTAVSVVVALTVQPGALYLLHVFMAVPLTAANGALLSLALASLALAWALRRELVRFTA